MTTRSDIERIAWVMWPGVADPLVVRGYTDGWTAWTVDVHSGNVCHPTRAAAESALLSALRAHAERELQRALDRVAALQAALEPDAIDFPVRMTGARRKR